MKVFFSIILITLLSSCSVGIIKRHIPHFKTTRALSSNGHKMSLKNIIEPKTLVLKDKNSGAKQRVYSTLDKDNFQCRLTTIDLPKDMNIRTYLLSAISDELDAAGLLVQTANQLTIMVHKIDSNTAGMSTGEWNLDFEYNLNSQKYRIKTKTEFESAFAAVTACRSTADSLPDAIAENLLEFFNQLAITKKVRH